MNFGGLFFLSQGSSLFFGTEIGLAFLSDVHLKDPDRIVSCFALQLKYGQEPILELPSTDPSNTTREDGHNVEENPTVHRLQELPDLEFMHLGSTFKELGCCMMELGLQLARVCDRAIGGREMEQSIIDSCTAKGRLIHYHSLVDSFFLKETNKRTKGITKKTGPVTHNSAVSHGSKTSGNKVLPEFGRLALDELPKLENLDLKDSSTKCWRTFSPICGNNGIMTMGFSPFRLHHCLYHLLQQKNALAYQALCHAVLQMGIHTCNCSMLLRTRSL